MELDPESWLDLVRREYLRDFVRDGGAAVKFIVARDQETRAGLREGLRHTAEEQGFQFAFVDAETTRIHMIDRLFHEVARQIDWDALASAFVLRLLGEQGLDLPSDPRAITLATIAERNDYPEAQLRTQIDRSLSARLTRDYAMSQDFRFAMLELCRARLDPGADQTLRLAVLEWLRGELRLISALKRALIFQRVARHNARHLLFSLAHWLKVAGRAGLVLVLDVARYADAARPAARVGGNYYSTSAVLDAYEVLRQLIDATDELEFCFVGVLAAPEMAQPSDDPRSMRKYNALWQRVADEVRDRHQPNPLASLVRLEANP